jgi:pectinesterase
MRKALYLLLVLLTPLCIKAQSQIIVDATGKGNFKTIQEAVNNLPDSSATDRVIFVKNGTYRERVVITKPHVILQGESREQTIITGSMANLVYQCEHPGDHNLGIVTIEGDDITIKSITIENTYGRDARDTIHIYCYSRITNKKELVVVDRTAHQFALYSSKCNRLKVINCIVRAWGNDTVSPWNAQAGMYYFKDCILQGGTDFYCPRGWAYADNCTFVCLQPSAAAIWHDGHADKNMKNVLVNCHFKGTEPYKLGRYHHDALFSELHF